MFIIIIYHSKGATNQSLEGGGVWRIYFNPGQRYSKITFYYMFV